MILIVTAPDDPVASDVEAILRRRGAQVVRFDAADFPARARISVAFRAGKPRYTLRVDDQVIQFDQLSAVWYRKPGAPSAASEILDPEVRAVIEQDCRDFLTSLWDSLDCRTLPGSPSAMRAAQLKASHMCRAKGLGFEVPSTVFTNDPQEFLDLYREHNGRLISKITGALSLQARFGTEFGRFTDMVSRRDVAYANSVAYCPIVLQAYVPKKLELRVTVVGSRVFAAEIHSQATHRTRVDWRRYDLGATPHYPHRLPEAVAARCVRLVADSNLSFGTIDLILTPDDRYVFLELNPAGEYAWIEDLTGLPISEAVADYLLGDTTSSLESQTREECHV